MNTAFKILFSVELLHDFYRGGSCTDFRFIPSEATIKLLANYNALYKTVGNRLIVLVKTDENDKPFIVPEITDKFTFYMELTQPKFMALSAINMDALEGRRYYFTNLHQNKIALSAGNNVLYLSKPLQVYDINKAYSKAEMVIHNEATFECISNAAANEVPGVADNWIRRSKNPFMEKATAVYDTTLRYNVDAFAMQDEVLYKCIVEAPPANKPAEGSAFWKPMLNNQFSTGDDIVYFIPQKFIFPLPAAATSIEVLVFKLNTANNSFDVKAMQENRSFEEEVKTVSVDFSKLEDAKYRVLVNGKEFLVYISNDAVYGNFLGVIDLYNHLPAGNDFAFYDAAGKLKDNKVGDKNSWLSYTIRFANRLAFWKYMVPKKGVRSFVTVPAGLFAPNATANIFTSVKPIPIQEQPHDFNLDLFRAITSEDLPAPNPDINTPGMLTKDGTDYYCNIYINY